MYYDFVLLNFFSLTITDYDILSQEIDNSDNPDNFPSNENNLSNSENDTSVISAKKEKRTTSWIWEYFEIISLEKAKCSFCG